MAARAHLLIRKGRVIDPLSGRDEVADLLVEDGRLVRIGASLDAPGAELIDAEGHWVIPGLVDACVHLSLPGSGRAGDIASETRAAAGAAAAGQLHRRGPGRRPRGRRPGAQARSGVRRHL